MNKNPRNLIHSAFRNTPFFVDIDTSTVNFSRPNSGLNCEFTITAENEESLVLVATYTLEGEERELDILIPHEMDELLDSVFSILSENNKVIELPKRKVLRMKKHSESECIIIPFPLKRKAN